MKAVAVAPARDLRTESLTLRSLHVKANAATLLHRLPAAAYAKAVVTPLRPCEAFMSKRTRDLPAKPSCCSEWESRHIARAHQFDEPFLCARTSSAHRQRSSAASC